MNIKEISLGQLVSEIKKRLDLIVSLDQQLKTISSQNIDDQWVSIALDRYNKVDIRDKITKDIVKRAAKLQLKNRILETIGAVNLLQNELKERIRSLYE